MYVTPLPTKTTSTYRGTTTQTRSPTWATICPWSCHHPNPTILYYMDTSCPHLPSHGLCNYHDKKRRPMYAGLAGSRSSTIDEPHGSHGCGDTYTGVAREHAGNDRQPYVATAANGTGVPYTCGWPCARTEWRAWWSEWASYAQACLQTADHEKWLCTRFLILLSLIDAVPQ